MAVKREWWLISDELMKRVSPILQIHGSRDDLHEWASGLHVTDAVPADYRDLISTERSIVMMDSGTRLIHRNVFLVERLYEAYWHRFFHGHLYVVAFDEEKRNDPDIEKKEVWTLSPSCNHLGWRTDFSCPSYGLPLDVARKLADLHNTSSLNKIEPES